MRFLPTKNTARRVFGQIANEYDLVYFGTVDPRIDHDYKIVGGLTASPYTRDENYTTGDVYDYEVAFLQRSREVITTSDIKQRRQWTILQVNFKKATVPHFLVDGRRRTEEYGALLASTQRWREIGWQHITNGAKFTRIFATYAAPLDVETISSFLTEEVQTMLATYFSEFDYEFQGNKLLVYATNAKVDLQMLDRMLRVGLWLARQLDK